MEPSISKQAPAPAHRVLEILVESVAEVPVVELCLRFAYDGVKALGKLAAHGLPQLLAVFKCADHLGMSTCCQAVLEAAAKLKAWEVGFDDVVMAWNSGTLPDNDHLQQLCTKALLHHFGDLLLVMRSEELRQTFMDLPLLAVLALLDSDDLATDGEDSVVAAVGCWVDYNEPNAEEGKQLAHHLRLLQLTEDYLHTVVPTMPWMICHLPLAGLWDAACHEEEGRVCY